jgi:EmrB/QacA subfamily drug resistance transporter
MRAWFHSGSLHKWLSLCVVLTGTFMSALDASVVNVSFPKIAIAFGTATSVSEWAILSYIVTAASTMLLFGRAGDMYGRKLIYCTGIAFFGMASASCALAPTLPLLIVSRSIQGLGAAMLASNSQAIIADAFPSDERGRAIGFNGAAVALAASSGPLIGGFVTTYFGWRWVFFLNLPLCAIALPLAGVILKRNRRERVRFDIPGAALASTALLSCTLGLSRGHVWGWLSAPTLACLCYAACATLAFVRWSRMASAPLIPPRAFANKTMRVSLGAAVLFFCANYSVVFTLPFAAQTGLGQSAFEAGVLLTPMFVLNIVLAPLAGRLSDTMPAQLISTIGAATFAAGLLTLGLLPDHPTRMMLLAAVALAGAGTAVFAQPNNNTIMGSTSEDARGAAAGMLASARAAGQSFGVAIAGALYAMRAAQLGPLAQTFAPAKAVFFTACALMLIAAFAVYFKSRSNFFAQSVPDLGTWRRACVSSRSGMSSDCCSKHSNPNVR